MEEAAKAGDEVKLTILNPREFCAVCVAVRNSTLMVMRRGAAKMLLSKSDGWLHEVNS